MNLIRNTFYWAPGCVKIWWNQQFNIFWFCYIYNTEHSHNQIILINIEHIHYIKFYLTDTCIISIILAKTENYFLLRKNILNEIWITRFKKVKYYASQLYS